MSQSQIGSLRLGDEGGGGVQSQTDQRLFLSVNAEFSKMQCRVIRKTIDTHEENARLCNRGVYFVSRITVE